MASESYEVDVAIIGAGTAGLGARRAAKAAGASALMIDPGPFGTTCARVGCMPSKLLIAAADAAHHAREASVFGVHADVRIDGEAVMARVQSERDRFVGFVNKPINEAADLGELLRERAEIIEPGLLRAGEHTVRYERLVIASGGQPFIPPPFRQVPRELVLTNEDVFEMQEPPESLLVVGLGVIGLELGQAFSRLGVRTTLVGVGGAVGPLSDPDVKAACCGHFQAELDLHPDYEVRHVEVLGGRVRCRFVDSHGHERDETYDKILVAAGRRAGLGALGVEALGVDPANFEIDAGTLQLQDLPVFIAGDANGLHPLLHEAVDDGRIAGTNAANFPDVLAPLRRTPLAIVFSDPQIALVGRRYDELDGCAVSVGEIDYGDQGRSRVQNINRGLVRIYADEESHTLLGAEMFGPRVEHMAHLLAWAVQSGMTVETALSMPFYHPVVEEGLRTALRSLATNLRERRRMQCEVSEHGVGA